MLKIDLVCPTCKKRMLSAYGPDESRQPEPGDPGVCRDCGSALILTADGLKEMTVNELVKLERTVSMGIMRMKAIVENELDQKRAMKGGTLTATPSEGEA